MICRPQENQSAAFASDRSQDTDELTETGAVYIRYLRQIQYELEMAFIQQFVDMFAQRVFEKAQSPGYIHDDHTRQNS